MKINPNYKLREIAGETIVVNQGTAGMDMTRIISLNVSARLLYESLAEKEFTTEDAAHILTATYGIGHEQVFFDQAADEDWKQCHQIAAAQGVMALAWDGVLRLPKSELETRFFLSFQFFSSTETLVEKLTF